MTGAGPAGQLGDFLASGEDADAAIHSIATDLALDDLYTREEVCERNNITDQQLCDLETRQGFKDLVAERRSEWQSVANTRQRVQLKMALAAEAAVPALFQLVCDQDEPAAARVAGFKELKSGAGLDKEEQGGGGGTGPQVIINLGDGNVLTFGAAQRTTTQPLEGSLEESVEEATLVPYTNIQADEADEADEPGWDVMW